MLPDINFWLALTFQSHAHHRAASTWFDSVKDRRCYFCRQTQQGFLRLATNPRVFAEEAVPLREAWGLYDILLLDPRVVFSPEPEMMEAKWREYTQRRTFSPKVWNDAYLAAFASAAGLTIITFDRGFTEYFDVETSILS